MAPVDQASQVDKRYTTCNYGYYYSNNGCYYSGWTYWGRWVFAAVIIVFVLALFVCMGCINSRRRRKRGMAPLYGTGWMAPQGKYAANNGYGQNPQAYAPPPPQYSAAPQNQQYTGQTFNSNDGYYGHHEGVAAPNNTYQPGRGGENVYEPPAGPPPGK